jgi:phage shock protein C
MKYLPFAGRNNHERYDILMEASRVAAIWWPVSSLSMNMAAAVGVCMKREVVMSSQGVMPNRIYRSRQERMVAGVAGGLGQYLGIDPVLVRLAFVVFALASGVGLLVYIVMAIVVPERPLGEEEPPVAASSIGAGRGRELAGYVLLGLGVIMLASTMGWFHWFNWGQVWPLVLVGLGVWLLLKRNRE